MKRNIFVSLMTVTLIAVASTHSFAGCVCVCDSGTARPLCEHSWDTPLPCTNVCF